MTFLERVEALALRARSGDRGALLELAEMGRLYRGALKELAAEMNYVLSVMEEVHAEFVARDAIANAARPRYETKGDRA